jgi:hypothetical protein
MSRRTVFSIAAAAVAGAGLVAVGGVAVTQAASHPAVVTAIVSPAPTTAAPTADPTTPATPATPDPTASASPQPNPRVWRAGDRVVTLQQILDFYATTKLDHADPTWYQEKAIEASCMKDEGWYFDPRMDPAHVTKPVPTDPAARLALYGSTGGGDAYRWQDAGCVGLAVHETGNDDNH